MKRLVLCVAMSVLAACGMPDREMEKQPAHGRGDEGGEPASGSVAFAHGAAAEASSARAAHDDPQAEAALDRACAIPFPSTLSRLRRGRERFGIFCEPCHSPVSDGDGRIVRRGFPAPPSYHQDRLRDAPDRHLYDVVRDGYGAMPGFADRIDAEDRWSIVAYVRALQLSRHVPVEALPADARSQLPAAGSAP
jgi:mono/diheme cytochrome c family protein